MRRLLVALVVLAIGHSLIHAADPDPVIVYQGRVSQDGTAVTGTHTFAFSLIDVGAGGTALWSSGSLSLSVNEGLYAVVLGGAGQPAIPTSVLTKADLAVRVTYEGNTLSPDAPLKAALQARYAFVAGSATTADSATALTGVNDIAHGGTGASSVETARGNLGLGDAATRNVGTTAGTVAAGDDSRWSDFATMAWASATFASATHGHSPSDLTAGDLPTDVLVHTASIVDGAVTKDKLANPIIVNTSTSAAMAANAGGLRWDAGNRAMQVSDGYQWRNLTSMRVAATPAALGTISAGELFHITDPSMEGLWCATPFGVQPLLRQLFLNQQSDFLDGEHRAIPIDSVFHGNVIITVSPTSPTNTGFIEIVRSGGIPKGCDILVNIICFAPDIRVIISLEGPIVMGIEGGDPATGGSFPGSLRSFRLVALGGGWCVLPN